MVTETSAPTYWGEADLLRKSAWANEDSRLWPTKLGIKLSFFSKRMQIWACNLLDNPRRMFLTWPWDFIKKKKKSNDFIGRGLRAQFQSTYSWTSSKTSWKRMFLRSMPESLHSSSVPQTPQKQFVWFGLIIKKLCSK